MRRWLKAVLTVSLIAAATATAQTPEERADLALAAAHLAAASERTEIAPHNWRYITNPDLPADAVEVAPEEIVQPGDLFKDRPTDRPAGVPEAFVPVQVYQVIYEGEITMWRFLGWLWLSEKDVLELHEDLVTA